MVKKLAGLVKSGGGSHKEWIIAWLQEYPHLSAAQIKDWLLERFPDLKVADSTTRLYVNEVREEYC